MKTEPIKSMIIATLVFGLFMGGLLHFYGATVILSGRSLTPTEVGFGALNDTKKVLAYSNQLGEDLDSTKWNDENAVTYTLDMTFAAIIDNFFSAGDNLLNIIQQSLNLSGLSEDDLVLLNATVAAIIGTIITFAVIYLIFKVIL